MSTLSDRMRQRRLVHAPDPHHPSSLADLRPGGRARVVGYDVEIDATIARRLFDLGIVPGTEVVMVRRAPLRDPVIYRVADYEIALRRTEARCIHVAAVS